MGSEVHFLCCHVLALWCDFGVGADIGGVPSFFNIAHVSISKSQLPASMRCYLAQNIKHEKENSTNHRTHPGETTKKKE